MQGQQLVYCVFKGYNDAPMGAKAAADASATQSAADRNIAFWRPLECGLDRVIRPSRVYQMTLEKLKLKFCTVLKKFVRICTKTLKWY